MNTAPLSNILPVLPWALHVVQATAFDRQLLNTFQWRGETYSNTRTNMQFVRAWGAFFGRHHAGHRYDTFKDWKSPNPILIEVWTNPRREARAALRTLRAWYPKV